MKAVTISLVMYLFLTNTQHNKVEAVSSQVSCNSETCKNTCDFSYGPLTFGRSDGTIISDSSFKIKMTNDNIICHNKGNWKREGLNAYQKPFRSPCEILKSKEGFPDFWLSDFSVITGNRISFKWHVDNWEDSLYHKPNTVYLNQYLTCHPEKKSMVIVEDNNKNNIFTIGVPVETSYLGSDKSGTEVIILGILSIISILLFFKICLFNEDISFSDFLIIFMLMDTDNGHSGYGGWSDD